MTRIRVDGVDYSPEGIEVTRHEMIGVRDEAMKQLPDSADFVILSSHIIALLADYREARVEEDNKPDTVEKRTKNEPAQPRMTVIDITDPRVMAMLIEAMANIVGMSDAVRGGLTSIRVGIDPLDNGLKFSVERSTWSPPYRGEIS